MSDILADNAARSAAMGGNSDLYTPGIATSVKTGTTNDVKDNWTVGYTRNVANGVWVGNNN
jgi:membrane peptidoglycan carboxypeptidase